MNKYRLSKIGKVWLMLTVVGVGCWYLVYKLTVIAINMTIAAFF